MKICAVIPARNEMKTIARTVRACAQFGQVIVADDSSTDSTALVASMAGALVVPVPADRPGLAGVYRHGLNRALELTDAEWIWEVDAGGSHDPSQFERFVPWLDYAPMILFGRRFGKDAVYDGPLSRRVLSWMGTVATNFRFESRFADATSGFICYHRRLLGITHAEPFLSSGHYYQTEVRRRVLEHGFSKLEIPITFRTTKSSLRWRAVWEAVRLAVW